MYMKFLLASALLASSTATAFNGPNPLATTQIKRSTGSALQMSGGAAPALKVCSCNFTQRAYESSYFTGIICAKM